MAHSPVLHCGHPCSFIGIYFAPNGQAIQSTWHYIDCDNGALIEYEHGATSVTGGAYFGGAYSPTENSTDLSTPLARNPHLSLKCSR